MRCPGCDFFNIPTATECGRCGSPLRLNSLAIEVEPPRASATSKRLRRWMPSTSVYELRDAFGRMRQDLVRATGQTGFTAAPWTTLLRMILPGWALFHNNLPALGWAFLGPFLALLLLGLLFFGTFFGAISVGIAFGVHLGSNLWALRLGGLAPAAVRWNSVIIALGMLAFLYVPIGWLIHRYAEPMQLNYTLPPLQAGDVLLLDRTAYQNRLPRHGEIVLFNRPMRYYPVGNGPQNVQIYLNQAIDRVLALPGDRVRWENQQLWVNDQPSPWQPLNPARVPPGLKWGPIPEGALLVVPSISMGMNQAQITPRVWQDISLVAPAELVGRLYFRTAPLTRWGWLR